jgi:UDP-N-acetylmuramoyl-L-alanyl-D-glutamate--2,6-diaminopimelate ligase
MTATTLRALSALPGVQRLVGDATVSVSGICSDSRRVERGDLFVALSGRNVDGARFIEQALARGAGAVLSDRQLELPVPLLVVDDARRRLGFFAQHVYRDPTRELRTVGVTGTNGKTTVTHLLERVLLQAGALPALLGTIVQRGPLGEEASELTTPEADRVASFARRERDAGATHLLLEVSSVAMAEHRMSGMRFDVAAFTNLTHDHLDYHKTFAAYGEEKARLFTELEPAASVINVDDPFGAELAQRTRGKLLRVSCDPQRVDVELAVQQFSSSREGIRAELRTPAGPLSLVSPLFGAHNVENLAVTVGCALSLGLDPRVISEGLQSANGAPGRMERVPDRRGVLVLVDYAHTPDALARALAALRPLTSGRLWVVFGCGGDRDRQKRAPMATAAAQAADISVLTSDNPRTESVAQILADMEPGASAQASKLPVSKLRTAACGYVVIPDRAQAIAAALEAARSGDTVLLAGKGHETYQIVGNTRYGFDDRIQAARALSSLGGD